MRAPLCTVWGFAIALTAALAAHPAGAEGQELVTNPGLAAAEGRALPEHWSAVEPVWEPAGCRVRATPEGLVFDAPGRPYAVGGVSQDISGVEGGRAYAVEVCCRIEDVPSPLRSVYVRVRWLHGQRQLHPAGWLVRGPFEQADGSLCFRDVLVAPDDADGARLSLEVHWPEGGSIVFRRASLTPSDPPKPRKVKVGTVFLRPRNSTPEKNLDLWCEKIDEAGRLGLDVVCLGEAITMVGTGKNGAEVAEPIPGPSTERLGRAARENKLWVVAGLMERDGDTLYNTGVLIDRKGKLAGTYRKVHLPREEWTKGVTPGGEYPVFQTDFGMVAIQVCYDWFFPEVGTTWALKGAEIVFAPTWGNTLPDRDGCVDGETTFRVRARDNGIYLVPSVYDGNSLVIDPLGRVLASNEGREGVAWAEIDLAKREPLPWVGHWRSIGPRHRMPATYGPLLGQERGHH